MIFKDISGKPMFKAEFLEASNKVILDSTEAVNGHYLEVILVPVSLTMSWEEVYQAGAYQAYCATDDGSYVRFTKCYLGLWSVVGSNCGVIGEITSADMEMLFKTYLSTLYRNSLSLDPEKDLASRVEELEDEVYFLNEGKRRKAKRLENLGLIGTIWFLMLIPTSAMFLISDVVDSLTIRLLLIMLITTLSGFSCYKLGVHDGVEKCEEETEED
ncbi:hypothetical protein cd2_104 [Carnobacterium phage cd2]|uniref:Uncharacterized protein n=1 Tax=Carnobacterium phage cd2 TaxID=2849244 RepID=A0AAE7SW34_9CAUD|nr:hypothetical protein PQD68_gp104 [Carnobacterium phage cd2]QXP45120.1 hypothetical protein cd2_104 [Carnobacterium phage cd2]